MDDGFIQSEVRNVIAKGIEIDFLANIGAEKGECYKITTNPRRANSLERHLKAKWIKSKLEKELEKMTRDAIIEIREKFDKARAQMKLSDFAQGKNRYI